MRALKLECKFLLFIETTGRRQFTSSLWNIAKKANTNRWSNAKETWVQCTNRWLNAKRDITPLLKHWRYISFASSHQNILLCLIRTNSMAKVTNVIKTRTTRMPAFWGYPPLPHDYPYYWFMSDPKSKEDKVKVTNLKNLSKLLIF